MYNSCYFSKAVQKTNNVNSIICKGTYSLLIKISIPSNVKQRAISGVKCKCLCGFTWQELKVYNFSVSKYSHLSCKNQEPHFWCYFVKKRQKQHFRTKNNTCKNAFSHIYDCFTCKLARINQYCAPYICMHRVHLLILDILLPPVISSSNSLHFEVKKVQ